MRGAGGGRLFPWAGWGQRHRSPSKRSVTTWVGAAPLHPHTASTHPAPHWGRALPGWCKGGCFTSRSRCGLGARQRDVPPCWRGGTAGASAPHSSLSTTARLLPPLPDTTMEGALPPRGLWPTVAVVNAAAVLERCDEQALPAVYAFIGRSWGVSPTQLGAITLARALTQTLSSPLGGVAGERLGLPCSWNERCSDNEAVGDGRAVAESRLRRRGGGNGALPRARSPQATLATVGACWARAA